MSYEIRSDLERSEVWKLFKELYLRYGERDNRRKAVEDAFNEAVITTSEFLNKWEDRIGSLDET